MAANGATSNQNPRTAASKPAPTGPAPPVPASAPPHPPNATSTGGVRAPQSSAAHNPNGTAVNGATSHAHPPTTNATTQKGKKKAESVDPAAMYETVRNRIAALEEEEVHGEEEERRIGA
jgi:hypothetical protein